jgi:hypothetical protein
MAQKHLLSRGKSVEALGLLHTRLLSEGEGVLAKMIERCNQEVMVKCACCAADRIAHHQCRKKWCPLCERSIAAKRSAELTKKVRHFQWPLFATFTMANEFDLKNEPVKRLKKAFRKLRHRRIWKDRVKGGCVCVEVTNRGNGWHVHLHAVIDCRWLSFRTPAPPPRSPASLIREYGMNSKHELEREWAKCLKAPLGICDVSRANRGTIAKEVVKYAVKGSDLIECKEPIGDIIRALQASRLMGTFGHCHGKGKGGRSLQAEIGAAEEIAGPDLSGNPFKCCATPHWVPTEFYPAARAKVCARDRHILAGRKPGWWKARIRTPYKSDPCFSSEKPPDPEKAVWNEWVKTPMPAKRTRKAVATI